MKLYIYLLHLFICFITKICLSFRKAAFLILRASNLPTFSVWLCESLGPDGGCTLPGHSQHSPCRPSPALRWPQATRWHLYPYTRVLLSLWVPCPLEHCFPGTSGQPHPSAELRSSILFKGEQSRRAVLIILGRGSLGFCQFLSKHKKQLLKLMQFTMCSTSSKAIFGTGCHLSHSASSATDFCSLFHFPQPSCGARQAHSCLQNQIP